MADIMLAVNTVKSSSSYRTANHVCALRIYNMFLIDIWQTAENNSDTTIITAVRSILWPHTICHHRCWTSTALIGFCLQHWVEIDRKEMYSICALLWPGTNQSITVFQTSKGSIDLRVCMLDIMTYNQCCERSQGWLVTALRPLVCFTSAEEVYLFCPVGLCVI